MLLFAALNKHLFLQLKEIPTNMYPVHTSLLSTLVGFGDNTKTTCCQEFFS